MLYDKTLYKQHSNGTIGTWRITVEQDPGVNPTCTMTVAAAKVKGGKEVITPTQFTKGKNIGRANETTPIEQAISEAEAKVKKKLDNGYVENESAAAAPVTNSLGFKKPMLAHPIEKVKNPGEEFYGQPKLDGHRCIATVRGNGGVILYSRQGKELDIPHIAGNWQRLYDLKLWNGQEMDGELYVHGRTLQQISSFVKKPERDVNQELAHHVYDTMMNKAFPERAEYIRQMNLQMLNLIGAVKAIQYVDTKHLCSQQEIDLFHATNMAHGYEGTILRVPGTEYEDGKRSRGLLKVKNFQDAEFEIIGVTAGKPKYSGSNVYDVAIYICRTADGVEFNVTAPGTMQDKHLAYANRRMAIGKMLTVKYFNLTPDGCPFHPVALRIREDV